jgi:LytS/YehU family sensor histidine kinase
MDSFDVFDDPRSRSDFFTYILLIGFFYINYFVLVPDLFFEQRYGYFVLATIVSFFLIVTIPDIFFPFHPGPGDGPPPPKPPGAPLLMFRTGNVFLLFLIVFFLSLMLRIGSRWRKTEKEKLGAELSYLKAQINPHFLFNTLNSIYSLALIKSDNTAPAIVKLSGMMRYVINEAHAEFVSLEKEISYIKSYIDLQQIRFGDAVQLSFVVNGELKGKAIAPLVLIPFVENAFKHGVNAEEDSVIKISIDIEDDMIQCQVTNNKVRLRLSEEEKSGLGIENTKARLQLLYPGSHVLTIEDGISEFKVYLQIVLT